MKDTSATSVSIIVPVYRTPLMYFRQCLNSLHSQTLSETEFIIVFDGEDADLYTFCKSYLEKDNRFKIHIQPHAGVSATRNYGIKQAKGEYITFVDADDWIEKNCCQATYNYAKENDSDVVLFDYNPVAKQNEEKKYAKSSIPRIPSNEIEIWQKQTIYHTDFKYVSVVSTWGKIIRKSLIEKNHIFFSEQIHIAVDRPFMFQVYLSTENISYLNFVFYNYNKVENSISYKKYYNKYLDLLDYLTEIKKISSKHSNLIGKQALIYLEGAWNLFYFEKRNRRNYMANIAYLCKVVKSQTFQDLISQTSAKDSFFITKAELFLLKRKIALPLWLRALKRMFF